MTVNNFVQCLSKEVFHSEPSLLNKSDINNFLLNLSHDITGMSKSSAVTGGSYQFIAGIGISASTSWTIVDVLHYTLGHIFFHFELLGY